MIKFKYISLLYHTFVNKKTANYLYLNQYPVS